MQPRLTAKRSSILVADDDVDIVQMVQAVLQTYGYESVPAYDGPQAIELARQVCPTSILLDVGLPVVTGFEVSRTLRASSTFSDTLIVGFSGYVGSEYYEKAKEAGMDFYLPKPADPEALIACLQPELYPNLLLESVHEASDLLREMSTSLLTKVQALSGRSKEAMKRAREIIHKNRRSFQL